MHVKRITSGDHALTFASEKQKILKRKNDGLMKNNKGMKEEGRQMKDKGKIRD